MEPEVGELLDQALVALRGAGERGLDALLADLARGRGRAVLEQARDVGACGPLGGALGDDAPEPRREARLRAGVARRAVRPDAVEQRVAVAVVADLLDRERVPRGRALVPELLARAAPEPRLARLARPPERPRRRRTRASARGRCPRPGRSTGVSCGSAIPPPSARPSARRAARGARGRSRRRAPPRRRPRTPRRGALLSPAPPEAITGTSTASATAAVSARS